jgi:hypothetical protein
MLESLRKLPFAVAMIALILVVLVELSFPLLFENPESGTFCSKEDVPAEISQENSCEEPTPGKGIPYMALVDGLLLFTMLLIALSLLIPERVHGRVQGLATLIFSLFVLLVAIVLIVGAIMFLVLMLSLFLSIPFGTIAYMAAFADFDVGAARGTLGALMTLKIVFAVALVLSQQRFLENKGLILLILTSLLANVIISILHGFVPSFLVSITDDIGAIVVGILAAIWALVFLIGSIKSVIKALRVDRALA